MNDAKLYPVEVRPLSTADGGGWLATFPDLPGCLGDGATPAAAIEDGYEAAAAWLKVAEEHGDPIPEAGANGETGRLMARLPKSLHSRLNICAAQEGVSMNTLVVSLLAEGIGARAAMATEYGQPTEERLSP